MEQCLFKAISGCCQIGGNVMGVMTIDGRKVEFTDKPEYSYRHS